MPSLQNSSRSKLADHCSNKMKSNLQSPNNSRNLKIEERIHMKCKIEATKKGGSLGSRKINSHLWSKRYSSISSKSIRPGLTSRASQRS